MKKAVITLCMGLLLCSGCGQKGEPVKKITFWAYATAEKSRAQKIQELVKKYNQEHPSVKVKLFFVSKDDFNTKINTSIAVGANPDCSYLDSGLVARFSKDKILLCLDDFIKAGEIKLKDFYPGALKMNKYQGKYYGLPLNQTCIALFYNKGLIKNPPTNWEELIKTAQKVYVPGKVAAFGVPKGDGYGGWMFPAFVACAGGSMLNEKETKATFNQKPGVEALKLWVELLKYSPRLITDSANAFETGKIAMVLSGPWAIEGIKTNFPNLKYGVAFIPKKVRYATNIGGESLVIYQNSKNPQATWDFVRYLLQDENQIIMSEVTGNFPVKLSLINHPKFKQAPDLKTFMQQIKYAVPKPNIEAWTKINDEIIAKAIDEALHQRKIPEQALNEAAKNCDAILQEEKNR